MLLYQYHAVFITIALLYSLRSGMVIPPEVWEANSKMAPVSGCCFHKQHHCKFALHANWVLADWPIPGGHGAFSCAGVHISSPPWVPGVPVAASRCSCNKGCWEESDHVVSSLPAEVGATHSRTVLLFFGNQNNSLPSRFSLFELIIDTCNPKSSH